MAMLHIIRSSGFTNNALIQCLRVSSAQDSILLMDDGCYNLRHPQLLEAQIKHPEIQIYYISLHASARAQKPINDAFTSVTLTQVLPLIFNHDNSITWS